MTTETDNVAKSASPEGQTSGMGHVSSPHSPTSPENLPKADYAKTLSEATKYTIFAVFTLYAIGFIIWHSYLGTLGVSSVGFLQAEYVSAAFCYLFLLGSFTVPFAVAVNLFRQHRQPRRLALPTDFLIFLWSYLATKLLELFFPSSYPLKVSTISFLSGLAVTLVLALFRRLLRNSTRGKKVFGPLSWNDMIVLGFFTYVMALLCLNQHVSKLWLLSAIVLYTIAAAYSGPGSSLYWVWSPVATRLLIICFLIAMFLANVQLFATVQFGQIPKTLGGGKPEIAYLKLSQSRVDWPPLLNISTSTNELTKGLAGPIAIFLRTEKEIIFMNYEELVGLNIITNVSTIMQSNSVFGASTTNVSQKWITNASGTHATNEITEYRISYFTNTYTPSITRTIFPNAAKPSARQIRADLVDAVIFTK